MRNSPLVYFDASNRTFHHVRDLGLSCGVPQYGWFTQGTGAKNWRWLVTEESERKNMEMYPTNINMWTNKQYNFSIISIIC